MPNTRIFKKTFPHHPNPPLGMAQFERPLTRLCMRHNPTKHLIRISVNYPRRLRRLLWLLIKRIKLPIPFQRKFQQIVIILSTSAIAMLRGVVALPDWELDGRLVFRVYHVTVTIVAVCEPVRIAGFGLLVGEGCLVGGGDGVVLTDTEIALGVGASPDL